MGYPFRRVLCLRLVSLELFVLISQPANVLISVNKRKEVQWSFLKIIFKLLSLGFFFVYVDKKPWPWFLGSMNYTFFCWFFSNILLVTVEIRVASLRFPVRKNRVEQRSKIFNQLLLYIWVILLLKSSFPNDPFSEINFRISFNRM